jgi:SPW repeat-containing protein
MKTLSWINVVLGLWLIAAAFVFPAGTERVIAAETVGGVLIAVLAYASAVGRPTAAISWSVCLAGRWNAMIVGVLVVILGAANGIHRHHAAATHA